MSVKAVHWAFSVPCQTPAERAVLVYLADLVNERDAQPACWPAQRRIAAAACIGERQARNVLRVLRDERGLIDWTARGRADGGRSTSRYLLLIPNWGFRQSIAGNQPGVTGNLRQVTGNLRQVTGNPLPTEPEHEPEHEPEERDARPPKAPSSDQNDEEPPPHDPQTPNPSTSKPMRKAISTWTLPAGIDPDVWSEFEAHRRDIRKPLTDRGRIIAANKLLTLTPAQQRELIDMVVECRWTGLYPQRVTNPGARPNAAH